MFLNELPFEWSIVYYITDFIFVIDIIVAFCTTVPDDKNFTEIIDRGAIATNYLTGWFWVDFISIVPFDDLISAIMHRHDNQQSNMN